MTLLTMGLGAAFNWHDFIVQALGFTILMAVLFKWVVPALGKMSADRTRGIEEKFTRLDGELAEATRKMSEYQQQLARIGEETQRRLKAGQEEAAKTRAALLAEAQAQAQNEMEKARREVQMERDKAVLELRAMVTELTVAATEKIVDAVMNEQMHGRMVTKYIGALEKGVRT